MIFAGLELARRLEAAEALAGRQCAEAQCLLNPASGATFLEVAGGVAIFAGAGSPLTHAVGLGMQGPVREAEFDRLEAFYFGRGATVGVSLCPLADPSLCELLAQRGYRVSEFNNVLARPLPGAPIAPAGIPVRLADPDQGELWARAVGRGFLEKDTLTAEEMDVGRAIFHTRDALCYLAFGGSQPLAAGAMAVRGGLALLFADSTIPRFRGAGLQSALIGERLRAAPAQACDLAAASTLPGSVSQRNYERNGFQVVYTKTILIGG